ncbi:hypothetical protein G7Y89_g13304 [Cudoniella acicularis]|uniref:DUF1996 domain-containing protein n=1 Tax=Cudoniella acicularis TaxID=354080 RepID=A0A8H4VW71_9HELO|nr:hypothetical protein G7Y89_g13304 [Cudoniella acicularis]
MKWFSIAAALVGPAQAGLRFGCSTLSIQRLDPLVEPGNIPSAHVHQIVGGNGFNATITTSDVSTTANCTTCTFSEDFSNYWTAALYFKARDGRYKRVPIYANADLESGIQGGMTIYYTQLDFNSNGKDNITAFQPGFRMTLGSPTTNTKDAAVKNTGLRYTCLQTVMTRGAETPDFPTKPCPAGIMAIHHFPAQATPTLHIKAMHLLTKVRCWDGKNLDSPDHQSHMFSTTKGAFQNAGPCPSSHPIRVPQLAYETLWNTTGFNDKSLWPTDGSQPFVWSTGDDKGYSTHGDYIFGWKGDSLQKAMDSTCMFTGCGSPNGPLKVQTGAQQNKCAVQNTVTEDTEGWLTSLPGRH